MKRLTLSQAAIILFSIGLISACSKSGSNPSHPNSGSLAVTSLSVNSGPYATQVTVTGTGFSPATADDQVTFNGHAATVELATSTQIITTVPLAAGTGSVNVTVGGKSVTGPVFTYQVAEVVTSFAGSQSIGSTDGDGAAAKFFQPYGIATDASGNVYVADQENKLIRKITPGGTVTTLAGSGGQGHADGLGTAASFTSPAGIAVDASGNVYVADMVNGLIRKITPTGLVSTLAGNGSSQAADGTGTSAGFSNPIGLAIDGTSNLFVADHGSGRIRKVTPAGVVTTVYTDINADIYQLVLDKAGNIYAANMGSNNILKITQSGAASVFAGGSGIVGGSDGTGKGASFAQPSAIAIDGNGNLFVYESSDNLLREITPGAVVTTIGGRGSQGPYGLLTNATFYGVEGITVDASGNIYLAASDEIRKISMQ